ncbi:lipoprotein-releasing system permease protein [Novimethylophilus kurashikiensis]|uniref:Lipoprotein-releasing system permease protein n=1 Tax=Novimethylophilus kurashikiensis TaxID=1825523 RepID=A0A2R5FBU5_9PROT|nr:lipoprotein-releasing ABC transporter permease subunit [Novimethylophilus kurashikiensis]GBG15687.1 lipoprotein-releasing system permease protein [Novimethylophilus kurashikiensis]
MTFPYELFIGLRYTRAKRRNHFISFISMTSMLGIALGVAALIVVLSVMNGFQSELRTRILGVASHIQITGNGNALPDWKSVVNFVKGSPQVQAAAPYIMAQGMLSLDQAVQGAMIRGILPAEEDKVADLGSHMKVGKLTDLKSGEFGIVLGAELAQSLGAGLGDKVVVMAPEGQFTPTGIIPRLKQFRVVGIFQVGMYEYDASLALIHMDDAAKLYRMGDKVSGVRLKLEDLYQAPRIGHELSTQLAAYGSYFVSDWTEQHANFFRAVQMEKRVMFVILTLIVAVAAFNIVSTLVMAVTDKRADIAILRTLGASPSSIMKIFIVQGSLIGVIGTLMGAVGGVTLALNIDVVVPFIEHVFGVQFLAKDVYYISDVPSQLQWADVITITSVSLVLSLLATLYPSWRAAKTNPAEALRYE